MRDTADHQHGNHDHAFGVGAAHDAAHDAGHLSETATADSSTGALHGGLGEHITVSEGHAGTVLPGPAADPSAHAHLSVDDHAHIGEGGGGHFGLGIEHDHADGLSGLHDTIHDNGLGFHGDDHHGLGDGLHVGHDHADTHADDHHSLGDLFHH